MMFQTKPPAPQPGKVYCPSCTHAVDASVAPRLKCAAAVAGQRCPRCTGLLDAAHVLQASPLASPRLRPRLSLAA